MDRQKTGALIAQMRKERGLTQRELAEQLHISDRAVSKWERGAGFPDVSMLIPLAEALGLSVLELLRGEQSAPCDSEGAFGPLVWNASVSPALALGVSRADPDSSGADYPGPGP